MWHYVDVKVSISKQLQKKKSAVITKKMPWPKMNKHRGWKINIFYFIGVIILFDLPHWKLFIVDFP
jgi:hypothetical protein